MAQDEAELAERESAGEAEAEPARVRSRRLRRAALAGGGIVALLLGYGWLQREKIADDVISGQLESLGLPARYEIVSIGPRRQVLRNIVIGDPAHPDLTIERAEIGVSLGWGAPRIGSVSLLRPRLHGSYRNGKLSFGSLDPLIFTGSKEPFRLPELDLAVTDGRGLLDADFGAVGFKLDGSGGLRGGFAATVAAIAPHAQLAGCRIERASLYGRLAVTAEKPRFTGPLRLRRLDCGAGGLALAGAGLELDAVADPALDGGEGSAGFRSGRLALAANSMAGAAGKLRFNYRKQALIAHYALTGSAIATPQLAAGTLSLNGVLRGSGDLARLETEGEATGSRVTTGRGLDAVLADGERSGAGTLVAPLLGRMRAALAREGQASTLSGSYVLRRSPGRLDLVVPQAALRGGSGATLLAVSRLQYTTRGDGPPLLAGNFATGGEGLPHVEGRMERRQGGALAMRMAMAEYRSGDARIAVPRFSLVQLGGGALGFSGEARLAGALPGGRAEGLVLPIEGNWSPRAGVSLWRRCTVIGFERLTLADLSFDRRRLPLCPPPGTAIVRRDGRGTRIAVGVPSLDLTGRLGATPIRIRSGAAGMAMPGTLDVRDVDVALGPAATASRFRIARLGARIGNEVAGRFAGSEVLLAAVPLDIREASGAWRFADGRLTLSQAGFRLSDRAVDSRFQPLVARDAALVLADNRIVADAILREPASDREVVRAAIRHDLASGSGTADLAVPGILFDDKLQPDTISRLALGVLANTYGTVRGEGRIAWDDRGVTSTGRFTTDSLDFAAAFGPLKGLSGTVAFTDLLGLVTAPDQQLRIASINPGIEVTDGLVTFEMQPNNALLIKQGSWPFLDGRLTLQPVRMNIGVAETRRYVLVIEGLNAARFVERMELANLAATGTFDGALPLVFDENGGHIEGGLLHSRPPGGNVSYVGALSYKDLSAMANFAFDALKSVNYREMSIGMDGALDGEIVTRVRFDGISQGEGTKRNFLTDRIAKLPIRFNINIKAPFQQLITSFKSLYDPAYVRDPRTLGLLDAAGRPVARPAAAPPGGRP